MSCMRPCHCMKCNTLINNDEGGYCWSCWDKIDMEHQQEEIKREQDKDHERDNLTSDILKNVGELLFVIFLFGSAYLLLILGSVEMDKTSHISVSKENLNSSVGQFNNPDWWVL